MLHKCHYVELPPCKYGEGMRCVAREKKHCCNPVFRADTLFIQHDCRYSASHPCRDAHTRIHTGTKFAVLPEVSTNARSVSKATRTVTCRQHNIACADQVRILSPWRRGMNIAKTLSRARWPCAQTFVDLKRRSEHGRRDHP